MCLTQHDTMKVYGGSGGNNSTHYAQHLTEMSGQVNALTALSLALTGQLAGWGTQTI